MRNRPWPTASWIRSWGKKAFPVDTQSPAIQSQITKAQSDQAVREAQGFSAKRAFEDYIQGERTKGSILALGFKQAAYTPESAARAGATFQPEARRAFEEHILSSAMMVGGVGPIKKIFGKKGIIPSQAKTGIQGDRPLYSPPKNQILPEPRSPLSGESTGVSVQKPPVSGSPEAIIPPHSNQVIGSYNEKLAQKGIFYNIERLGISEILVRSSCVYSIPFSCRESNLSTCA